MVMASHVHGLGREKEHNDKLLCVHAKRACILNVGKQKGQVPAPFTRHREGQEAAHDANSWVLSLVKPRHQRTPHPLPGPHCMDPWGPSILRSLCQVDQHVPQNATLTNRQHPLQLSNNPDCHGPEQREVRAVQATHCEQASQKQKAEDGCLLHFPHEPLQQIHANCTRHQLPVCALQEAGIAGPMPDVACSDCRRQDSQLVHSHCALSSLLPLSRTEHKRELAPILRSCRNWLTDGNIFI